MKDASIAIPQANGRPEGGQHEHDLETFLKDQKEIPYSLPSSSDFEKLASLGFINNTAKPLAFVRPQDAEQVSRLIAYLAANRVPFTIRSGGNNLFGKSQVDNAVCIDLRSINFCQADREAQYARIGGGILFEELIDALQSKGLSTVTGMVPPIGYVGWATYGGYGPFAWLHGLGHEAIIGAKVVDWRGRTFNADFDLLKGIRGAGGSFGVIVELTIKVYPLGNFLAGQIIFDESDTKATVRNICRETQRQFLRPSSESLYMAPLFIVTPMSKAPFCHVMWLHQDQELGKKEIDKITRLGPFVYKTTRKTTHAGATDDFKHNFVMPGMKANIATMSIYSLTDEVIDVIAHYVNIMPDVVGSGFAIHSAKGTSKEAADASSFNATEAHFMLEFMAGATSDESLEATTEWLQSFLTAMRNTDQANILPSTYVNLTPPGQNTLKKVYGHNYDFIIELQKKHDPHGVFRASPPFVTLA
ncbi:hypothetical protein FAVG1_08768 [Fusarium avenaceum]|nr:hypothetical protein FAVG1_08768 [Fusarium avenaceum]